MSKEVYANGKEVSAKNDDNKSIAAMPDVCLTPPSPPAGPIPIPYPNTAKASDTSDGSKTVKIGGDEVGLKNSSNYKQSTGDEAATKSQGMNLTTHTIQGKMKHAAWSFDVKFEGQNAIRHMDLTTHNHMNTGGTGSMTTDQAKEKAAKEPLTCKDLDEANEHARTKELKKGATDDPIAVTTANWRPTQGQPSFVKGVSSGDAPLREFQAGYQPKAGAPDRRFIKSPKKEEEKTWPPCTERGPPGAGVRVYDSESKVLRSVMNPLPPGMAAGSAGSITISTWHKGSDNTVDRMPCDWCKIAICGAVKCGIKVTLCAKDGKEVDPAKEHCKDGKPQPEGNPKQSPPPTAQDKAWAKSGL
jgi:hypothetical protein